MRFIETISTSDSQKFEPAAVEAIYQATQSLPRKVHRLALYALTASAIAKGKSVTAEHVQAALSETGS